LKSSPCADEAAKDAKRVAPAKVLRPGIIVSAVVAWLLVRECASIPRPLLFSFRSAALFAVLAIDNNWHALALDPNHNPAVTS
jgi:hypothetical protein